MTHRRGERVSRRRKRGDGSRGPRSSSVSPSPTGISESLIEPTYDMISILATVGGILLAVLAVFAVIAVGITVTGKYLPVMTWHGKAWHGRQYKFDSTLGFPGEGPPSACHQHGGSSTLRRRAIHAFEFADFMSASPTCECARADNSYADFMSRGARHTGRKGPRCTKRKKAWGAR